jgi:predicted metalloprotease with PDZ domain
VDAARVDFGAADGKSVVDRAVVDGSLSDAERDESGDEHRFVWRRNGERKAEREQRARDHQARAAPVLAAAGAVG